MRRLLVLLALTLGFASNAAHLVGGEITYTCLGSNQYQVKLRIYRDCFSGGAAFDNSVNFTVYNLAGAVVTNPSVPKGPTVSVPAGTGNPCLTTPPNICTEYAEYVATLTLPPVVGGYTISYQRCCRNSTISNITNPGSRGNTYTVKIPSMDNTCNSTPAFTTVPPIVLCLGDQLNVDASATDSNGDSLFYEFCDIYTGGSSGNPSPSTATPPPYTTIPFVAPATPSQPVPGTPALAINPQTGMITGVATTAGQYVVGICVSEYRNGQLLSVVRRDYQFNVTNCIINTVADMVTQLEDPSLYCDGRTLTFTPQTTGALTYFWNFGDTTTSADTSSQAYPTYTFPDTGTYTVTLIINPGLVCTDTLKVPFRVMNAPDYRIEKSGVPCVEVQNYRFEAKGSAPYDASISWDFGSDANTFGATGKLVTGVSWNSSGVYPVRCIIQSAYCPDTLWDTVKVYDWYYPVTATPQDTQIARGDTVLLDVTSGASYYWFADQPVYFNNAQQRNPQALMHADSTTYYVIVTDNRGCRGIDTVLVSWLPDQVEPDLSNVMNVITPNGDGNNDVLDLTEVLFGDACTLRVMNRWGTTWVYETENYANTWGGTDADGNLLPSGTYYFFVVCGRDLRYSGPVTIVY
ncbi:MAG: gliding motility-associated C-terminal domain-containing protein [Schleiferiaceae bacterium]